MTTYKQINRKSLKGRQGRIHGNKNDHGSETYKVKPFLITVRWGMGKRIVI